MRICANKLGYPIWRRCQKILLSQWFILPTFIYHCKFLARHVLVAGEFIMNHALIKSVVVNRVKVFAIYLFVV